MVVNFDQLLDQCASTPQFSDLPRDVYSDVWAGVCDVFDASFDARTALAVPGLGRLCFMTDGTAHRLELRARDSAGANGSGKAREEAAAMARTPRYVVYWTRTYFWLFFFARCGLACLGVYTATKKKKKGKKVVWNEDGSFLILARILFCFFVSLPPGALPMRAERFLCGRGRCFTTIPCFCGGTG
jgi:hypothetical protein